MTELSPKVASEMAEEVYAVNKGSIDMEIFLSRPEFSGNNGAVSALTANVGSRFIHTYDAFGVCAQGGKDNKNDIFIIFRGSTKLGADWLTNARMGIQRSHTGWPVHIGFNTAFKSMLPQIQE